MAVFTFICKQDGDSWSAKQHAGEHDLEASADSVFDLQRQITKLALGTGSSGAVSSSFSYVTPSSAVCQVIIGGGGGGFFGGAGGAAAAPAAGGAAAAPAAEEKKEEPKKEEEESDDDMGFSLFD